VAVIVVPTTRKFIIITEHKPLRLYPVLLGLVTQCFFLNRTKFLLPVGLHLNTNLEMTVRGKGKVHPRTGHEGPEGKMYSCTLSLTSALDGVGG
jgi:hypothetical protein